MASSYKAGYGKAVTTADGKRFMAYAPGATESDPMIATAIVSGNVIDPTTLNGKTLKPLDGYTITAPDGISLMDGTTAKTPDFTITTGAGTESEVTTHYYIYKASTEEDPVTVTLSYSGTDFVTLGSLPEGTTLDPVENQPMQRNLTFPAGDVALTTTAVTGFTVSDDTYICDGTVKTPTIMLGESTFEATNYTMAFEKNGEVVNEAKNVGTYSVVLTGLGQYLGTAILPNAFAIITQVKISVVDIANGEAIVGATVQLIDSEDNVVREWNSTTDDTDTPYVNENIHVIEGLKAGVEYTIHETIAPNGYALSSDTKFTIDEVGKITSTGTISEDGVLLVENSMTIDLTVTAVWEDNNNEKGSRPASVIVNLKVGDETIHSKELNATNNWTATVTGLAKYDQQGSNGSEIVYTWTPAPLTDDDYVLAPPSTEGTATTLTYNYYPAVTVTITGHNNETTYDGTEHTISGYEVTNISYSLYTASDFTFSGTASASQTNAGTKNMGLAPSQFVNSNANYDGKVTFTIAADGYQTITPAPVTVKADDKSKEWGDADPALTATVTGMVNNEDANTLITYTVDREHGTIKDGKEYSGEYIITPTGADTQGNYAVTYETGKFTIKGKPTTIKNVDNEDVSSVENAFTITEDQDGVTLTLVSPDDNTLPPTVNIPKAVKVDHVNVDRIYVNGKASTVYLPFSIAYEKLSGGTFNTFTRVDETTDPWTVVYTEVTSGNIAANKPYIFLPDGSNGGKITVNNGVDEKITVSTVNQQSTTQGDWKFIGTYKRIKWTHDKSDPEYTADREAEIGSVYGFAAEEKSGATIGEFVKVGNNVWINPMRAYLKRSTTTARAMTPGAQTEQLPEKMKVVIVRADGSLTKVGTLDTRTGEISLDEWYSLDGRRLSSKPTTKGVYINNGKTVVIK